MEKIAIISINYNKPDALLRSFNNLLIVDYLGKTIDLIISIDYSGETDVEDLAKTLKWPFGKLIVRAFESRQGLKNHVLQCFEYAESYDIVFLLEDDIYASQSMFSYGYNAAKFYDNDDNIAGISLYNFEGNWQNWAFRFEPLNIGYDAYFIRLAQSWGEVVTKKQWLKFKEWYLNNSLFIKDDINVPSINRWPESSWLKYFHRYCFINDKFFVYPYISVVTNCNGVGIHNYKTYNDFQVQLQGGTKKYNFQPFKKDTDETIAYDEFLNPLWLNPFEDVNKDDITFDLWCTKNRKKYKKYVLTAGYFGMRYLKKISLSIHPIDLSIRNRIAGDGIYLYESSYIGRKKPKLYNLMNYSNRTSDWRRIKFYSSKLFFKTYSDLISKKFKQIFKRNK